MKTRQEIIAERIVSLREAAGLKQKELAKKAKISIQTLNKLENAKTTNPRQANLEAIATVLKCAVEDIDREPLKTEWQPMEYRQLASALTEKYEELEAELEQLRVELENFKNIPDDVKEKLLKVSDWNKVRISLDLPFVESGTAKKKAN